MKTISRWAFMMAFLFAATTVLGQQATPPAPAMNVLIGNVTASDTQAAANDKFAELLTKYSAVRLKATAHHGGALGSIAQMLVALQAGAVHGMVFPAGFLSQVVPEASLFDLPFLLPGIPANITAFAAQSKAAAKIMELAEQKGIHVIGFHGIGTLNFSTRFPVNTLADLQGKKIRVIPSPPRVGAYQDWGAVPRPLELGEVYTALQQGTIDGQETSPDVLYKMKYYEVAKYFTITEHTAFVSNVIVSHRFATAPTSGHSGRCRLYRLHSADSGNVSANGPVAGRGITIRGIHGPHIRKPVRTFLYADAGLNTLSVGITAHPDTIAQKPVMVRRFVKASLRGLDFAVNNPEAAVDILMKHVPNQNKQVLLGQLRATFPLLRTERSKG